MPLTNKESKTVGSPPSPNSVTEAADRDVEALLELPSQCWMLLISPEETRNRPLIHCHSKLH